MNSYRAQLLIEVCGIALGLWNVLRRQRYTEGTYWTVLGWIVAHLF